MGDHLNSDRDELRSGHRVNPPNFIDQSSGEQLCPHLAGIQIKDATILRTTFKISQLGTVRIIAQIGIPMEQADL